MPGATHVFPQRARAPPAPAQHHRGHSSLGSLVVQRHSRDWSGWAEPPRCPPLRPYLLSHCPALLRGTLHTLNPTLVHLVGSRGLTYPITLQAVLSHSPPHLSHWDPQDFCPSSLTWPVPTSQTCPCAAATAPPPRNITPQPNDFLISKAARCEMTGRHDATGM